MWIEALGSRGFEPGPVAVEGGPLGHCQFGGERKTSTNRSGTVMEQGTSQCVAPAFGSERGENIQAAFLKDGARQDAGVTANVVWYAVKRCARQAGISNLAPHDLRRTCARLCHGCGGELEQIQFLLGHASVQTTERYIGSKQKLQDAVNDRLGISVASDTA